MAGGAEGLGRGRGRDFFDGRWRCRCGTCVLSSSSSSSLLLLLLSSSSSLLLLLGGVGNEMPFVDDTCDARVWGVPVP